MAKSTRAETAARAAQLRAEATPKDRQRTQVIAASHGWSSSSSPSSSGSSSPTGPTTRPPRLRAAGGAAALATLEKLPASLFDKAPAPSPAQAPAKLQGGTPLTQDGKPKVLYIGAEYCPFCAMERWALIGALSRFGSFTGVTETRSSSTDMHPDTPTFSFKDAKYTSDVVAFEAVETQDRDGKPLQTLEGDNLALFQKFNPGGRRPLDHVRRRPSDRQRDRRRQRLRGQDLRPDHRRHLGPDLGPRHNGHPGDQPDQRSDLRPDQGPACQRLCEPGRHVGLRAAQAVIS